MKVFTKLSVILFPLMLLACTVNESGSRNVLETTFVDDVADAEVLGKWSRSCALCHITGEAGAPVLGDKAEWARRLAQGEASILQRVVEGYNAMPPLGYCMSCEIDDFRAMIAYMAGTNP